ncbi:MAG: LPP20 family lipoprotein, partial [Gallionellaceae bacterium]|nr:LPP20 family lipoprotein [Gallionellaceae bacterium]
MKTNLVSFAKFFSTVISAVVLFLPQFVFANQPSWIAGDSTEFSSNQYLLGRGVGGSLDEASARARGELASIFEVHIKVVAESDTTISRAEKNEQLSHVARQQISAKTDKVISGISIAKTWQNPKTRDFYALAVLSRAQAGASLREEMARIDA